MHTMRVSIIVPAFNEERLISGSLERINEAMPAFLAKQWETELIVCDNNSTDSTAELARAAGAKVVFEPINQIARARNAGAAAASGDWLIFIDADSYPSRELFAEAAEEIETGTCLGGGCTLRLEGDYRVGKAITGLWNRISRFGRLAAGSFIFCEAAAFRAVGGFSLELFAGEELDLSAKLKKRARELGRRIVILHRHPLLTSARKIHLYTLREHLQFMMRAALWRQRVLHSRAECHTWYDGRR
jgi:glycosyltransferase involved in cell wall biosynthesis